MTGDKYIVTSVGSNWCIVNTRTDVKKVIGRIGGPKGNGRGTNYLDKAKEEAAKRMGVDVSEVECVPSYFNNRQ